MVDIFNLASVYSDKGMKKNRCTPIVGSTKVNMETPMLHMILAGLV